MGRVGALLQKIQKVSATAGLEAEVQEAAAEQADAMQELVQAQERMKQLNKKIAARGETAKAQELSELTQQIDEHIDNVAKMRNMANKGAQQTAPIEFLQRQSRHNSIRTSAVTDSAMAKMAQDRRSAQRLSAWAASSDTTEVQRADAPEDELAKEMTHDLEMNFNKIAPFGKEDTAKELQDHAAKTQDTLVDAVENAEVAEIKRAVFRALTRLRAATIKEFDTIARLETQAIDAYNDAHHYRAENPLAHLHEDEAPVETDKLKSFH